MIQPTDQMSAAGMRTGKRHIPTCMSCTCLCNSQRESSQLIFQGEKVSCHEWDFEPACIITIATVWYTRLTVDCHLRTFLGVVHPCKHDFRSPPVACGNVASHNLSSGTAQTKVQDLDIAILTHPDIAWFQILEEPEWDNGIRLWEWEVL